MADERAGGGSAGTVFLVGAGPGDPGMLTVRAAELLASADAVVYDALSNPAILERHAPSAETHFLEGTTEGEWPPPAEVARRLAELTFRYRRVVRLTAGDPFVFGRGGREALALAEAGVPFEVVPGITAGIAVPAYAGIPVTHRGTASSVAFVAGREECPSAGGVARWEALAEGVDTLVIFMGTKRLDALSERLVAGGRAPETPAAVVEWGTHPRQRTVVGTLASIAAAAREAAVEAPSLAVIGEVVRLRERLAWFEARPLFGKRVVITRARAQAADFVRSMEDLGAEVIPFPTIRITDPADPEPLRRAVRQVDGFDWIVFTSVNGVERFWKALRASGGDTRLLGGISLCAIGPATAAAIELEGAQADLVPAEFVAEAVVEALAAEGELGGARILLPRAEVARSTLPDSLRERGAEIVEVSAYRTVPDGARAGRLREGLRRGEVDLLTFTASSTVRNFVDLVGAEVGPAQVACIGPITAGTARELGLPVHVEAESYTIPGLVSAIVTHFESSPPSR